MSATVEAEPLDVMILKTQCPNGCIPLADMMIFRTAHEGVFDHTDIHCEVCAGVWNTSMVFLPAWVKER